MNTTAHGSRRAQDEMDQPALRPLPERRYEYAEWKVARVGVDYHVEVDVHYYSVPYQHARAQVDVRVTKATAEILQRGQRIASHAYCAFKGRHTTIDVHMAAAHREVAGWNADTLSARAAAIGPRCGCWSNGCCNQRRHPQQAFRSCLGVLSLSQQYGVERLEEACARALKHSAVSWKSVQAILENGLDLQPQGVRRTFELPDHENLRGAAYYRSNQLLTGQGQAMLNHPTYDKLTRLKLFGMARAFAEQSALDPEHLGFVERLGLLVDHETTERDGRR